MLFFELPCCKLDLDAHIGIDIQQRSDNDLSLVRYLNEIKEEIGRRGYSWDRIKSYTNVYEYIHTVVPGYNHPVAKYKPLSRSFFKMIELIAQFKLLKDEEGLRSFHMAEGPGGFIEAVAHCRKPSFLENKTSTFCRWHLLEDDAAKSNVDRFVGITLIDEKDHRVPGWKKHHRSHSFLHDRLVLETGSDRTGNLLHFENYEFCKKKYEASMDFVTADGGFDFSSDYNDQENLMIPLLYAQILIALSVQKIGGHFVLKIFDCFHEATADILYWLTTLYEKVVVCKPCTSRMANSEKYVVCKHLRRHPTPASLAILEQTYHALCHPVFEHSLQQQSFRLLNCPLSHCFQQQMNHINVAFGQLQLENIQSTLNLIEEDQSHPYSRKHMDAIVQQHIRKCMEWCDLYGIPRYHHFDASTTHTTFRYRRYDAPVASI
jgi:23S rRNA U2552 (ribose-2'-O)-methylase RlmE/FtsJ